MPRRARDNKTLDLFEWTPPAIEARFEDREIRAASLAASLTKAMKTALRECDISRNDVAEKMSAYLGENVSKAMLDAYVSEAREDHKINVPRFMALVHATGDARLLSFITDPFQHAAVPNKYLPWIEAALLEEKKKEIDKLLCATKSKARLGFKP